MHKDFQPAVYLLASRRNGTLYTGVTSNLLARIHQHRDGIVRGFTRKYGVKLLVWFEQHSTMDSARKANQEMESRLEAGTHRIREP